MKDVQKLLKEIREYGEKNDVPISKEDTLNFLLTTIKENKYKQELKENQEKLEQIYETQNMTTRDRRNWG